MGEPVFFLDPFGLSLSKAAPFFGAMKEEGVPFDKLRANRPGLGIRQA